MAGLFDLDLTLLDWLPLTVSVHDREGRFLFVNRAFRELPGLRDGVVLGHPLLAFVPPPVRAVARDRIGEALERRTPAQLTMVFEDPRTSSRRFAATVSIIPLCREGRAEGFLALGYRDGDVDVALAEAAQRVTLTGRQREVLELLVRGKSTREIARALFITESAARNHVHHIIRRLGVKTRAEAVEAAKRRGLAPPRPVRYEDVPPLR